MKGASSQWPLSFTPKWCGNKRGWMMAVQMWDSSLLRSQIFIEAKRLYSLHLCSQVDWAECSISHQNLGSNETLTHCPGVMGKPLRDGLVATTQKPPVLLCFGRITGVLPRPNYLWFKPLPTWLIWIHARLSGGSWCSPWPVGIKSLGFGYVPHPHGCWRLRFVHRMW